VSFELPGIGAVAKENIQVRFLDRSLEVKIWNYNNGSLIFGVPKTMCKMNPSESKYLIKPDKLILTLRKFKKEKGWFSLHRVKTIGGSDED